MAPKPKNMKRKVGDKDNGGLHGIGHQTSTLEKINSKSCLANDVGSNFNPHMGGKDNDCQT